MNKTIGLLIVLVLIIIPIFPTANAITVDVHYANAGQVETATIDLQANQRVTGSFNISSGTTFDDAIVFSVRDPVGAIILNSGTVVAGENFSFTTGYIGTYTLTFDNSLGTARKHIQLEYDVNSSAVPEISPLVLVIALITLSSVIIIVKMKARAYPKQKTCSDKSI